MTQRYPYTPPSPISMGDLRLIAGIEAPCAGLGVNFEDWATLGFPALCGLTPIYPLEDVEPNTIEALRETP